MDVNNTVTQEIITVHDDRTNGRVEVRDEMDFIDDIYPRLETIYGLDICLDIKKGLDISEKLLKRGLNIAAFKRIEELMVIRKNFVDKNNNSLQSLFESINGCNDPLKSYANRVREHIEKEGSKLELSEITKDIETNFKIDPNMYRSCTEYEMWLEKNKNNVK